MPRTIACWQCDNETFRVVVGTRNAVVLHCTACGWRHRRG